MFFQPHPPEIGCRYRAEIRRYINTQQALVVAGVFYRLRKNACTQSVITANLQNVTARIIGHFVELERVLLAERSAYRPRRMRRIGQFFAELLAGIRIQRKELVECVYVDTPEFMGRLV